MVVRSFIVEENKVCFPAWVDDLESFRRWGRSEENSSEGRFSYLHGEIWMDLSMEQIFWHNQVKGEFAITVGNLVKLMSLGIYFHDRTLLSCPNADLATEPDGAFASWETIRSGRLRFVEGVRGGFVELEGAPDLTLEVVSDASVHKDTEVLMNLYWKAGVTEYWLVDVRRDNLRFDIFQQTPDGYFALPCLDGWLHSAVLGTDFRLARHTDPMGNPQYTLDARR